MKCFTVLYSYVLIMQLTFTFTTVIPRLLNTLGLEAFTQAEEKKKSHLPASLLI